MERVDNLRMLRNSEEKIGQENSTGTRRESRNCRKVYLVGGFVLLAGGILCVLVGLYASKLNRDVRTRNTQCPEAPLNLCEYSDEAKRVKLPEFLNKVHEVYYKLYPETHAWEINISDEEATNNVGGR